MVFDKITKPIKENFNQQKLENRRMKIVLEETFKTIEEQRIEIGRQNDKLAELYKTSEDQRDEIEGLSILPTAYTNRVVQSLLTKDDTNPWSMQYASCLQWASQQTDQINALRQLVKMLAMELTNIQKADNSAMAI